MTRRKRRGRVSATLGLRLDERARRTQRVIERYRDKPFSWAGANCIRLAAAQARAMGHATPAVPHFHTALGAKRALGEMGAATVVDLLDGRFQRLPAAAFMLVGDLCALPGEGGMDAVCISDGQGNLFGWHDAAPEGLSVIKFATADVVAAWRL